MAKPIMQKDTNLLSQKPSRGFKVVDAGDMIVLSKVSGYHDISFFLHKRQKGYEISPASYVFKPWNSYFDYTQPERRYTRNRMLIKDVINFLREKEIWHKIINKNFFKVNAQASRNQAVALKEFKILMGLK